MPYNICFILDMAVRTLAGCVAELFGPAASPAPPANGSRCSETAALCPIAPGRYSVDLGISADSIDRPAAPRRPPSVGVVCGHAHQQRAQNKPTTSLVIEHPPRAPSSSLVSPAAARPCSASPAPSQQPTTLRHHAAPRHAGRGRSSSGARGGGPIRCALAARPGRLDRLRRRAPGLH